MEQASRHGPRDPGVGGLSGQQAEQDRIVCNQLLPPGLTEPLCGTPIRLSSPIRVHGLVEEPDRHN